jgi:hypothetical protein
LKGEIAWRRFGASAGRGAIVNDRILWPTADGLRVLNIVDGKTAEDVSGIPRWPAGNIVPAGSRLLVATSAGLVSIGPTENKP